MMPIVSAAPSLRDSLTHTGITGINVGLVGLYGKLMRDAVYLLRTPLFL